MAFNTQFLPDPTRVGAGATFGNNNTIISSSDYEDGLSIGKIANWSIATPGQLENYAGQSLPVHPAGLVLN